MFKKLLWGALALLALCGAAFAGFGSGAPAQEVARESLDLLKAMGHRSSTAHTYVGTCVTAIAHAKRYEVRKDAPNASIRAVWVQAAGHCRGMANTVCDLSALQAPREACNRIRAFEPDVH
ncbi:hypothetical protein [Ramlibacter sp. AN1133]|uniref:hypothetical protein n=1 Tax=Ramlibacter sp. AN1133 TaxID=3133429 RepID=UPI0030BF47DC